MAARTAEMRESSDQKASPRRRPGGLELLATSRHVPLFADGATASSSCPSGCAGLLRALILLLAYSRSTSAVILGIVSGH